MVDYKGSSAESLAILLKVRKFDNKKSLNCFPLTIRFIPDMVNIRKVFMNFDMSLHPIIFDLLIEVSQR